MAARSASKSTADSRKGNKRGKPNRKSTVGKASKSKPRVKGATIPHRGKKAKKKSAAKKAAKRTTRTSRK